MAATRLGKVRRFPINLRSRRAGLAASWTLIELILIGLMIWGVVELLPAILPTSAARSKDEALKHIEPIFRLAKTDDERIWAQLGNSEIVSVDLATLKTKTIFRRTVRAIKEFHVSRSGETFLVSLDKREIVIFRNKELLICEQVPDGLSIEAALSDNGQTAVLCFGQTKIHCWDLSGTDPNCFEYELADNAIRIVLDPSGEILVVSTAVGDLNLLEAKTGLRQKTLGRPGPIRGRPVISEDGRWLAITDGEALTMYDMRLNQFVWKVQTSPRDEFQNITFTSDGCQIAVAGSRERIQIFERSSGSIISEFPFNDTVNKIVISGDVLYIGAANSSFIRVVSLLTGKELNPIDLM